MRKWITFDLDGTLMQNPFVGHVFPEIERLASQRVGRDEHVLDGILYEHAKRISENRLVEAYDWDGIVSMYLETKKINHSIDIEKIVCQFCKVPAIYLLEDGVIELLQSLKVKGFSLAAVTNGYLKYQKPVMKALGLLPLFDQIITPEAATYAKPDHRIFNGIKGEIVFHVGDRVEHDVRSANEAGIPSVLINRNLPEELRCSPVRERMEHPEMEQFLLAKLNKEMRMEIGQCPKWARPNVMISEIKELVEVLPYHK